METMSFDLPQKAESTAAAVLTALMVGKTIRVLGPGDVGDMMIGPNRITVLTDQHQTVTSARFG